MARCGVPLSFLQVAEGEELLLDYGPHFLRHIRCRRVFDVDIGGQDGVLLLLMHS